MSIGPDLQAIIRYHDQDTVVSVHRRQRTETPGMLRYGVEWIELMPELKAHVFAALAPEHESPDRWEIRAHHHAVHRAARPIGGSS